MISRNRLMRWIPQLVRKLPPWRVLVATGLAIASYLVSSWWKADIEDQIADYSGVAGRVLAVEAQLNGMPAFEAYAHYWKEIIELERTQIAILNQTINKSLPLTPPILDVDERGRLDRVIDFPQISVHELISTLPEAVLNLDVTGTFSSTVATFGKKWWWTDNMAPTVKECIELGSDDVIGNKYKAKLSTAYQKEVEKIPELAQPSFSTFEQAAKSQLLWAALSDDVAKIFNRKFDPSVDSGANPFLLDEVKEANSRKAWALACLATQREWAYEHLSNLLRQLRAKIAEKLVRPLNKQRSYVADAEFFLYVMSALIAMFGVTGRTRKAD